MPVPAHIRIPMTRFRGLLDLGICSSPTLINLHEQLLGVESRINKHRSYNEYDSIAGRIVFNLLHYILSSKSLGALCNNRRYIHIERQEEMNQTTEFMIAPYMANQVLTS